MTTHGTVTWDHVMITWGHGWIELLQDGTADYGDPGLRSIAVLHGGGQSPDAELTGGHAMTVVGYNAEGFIVRNSWGAGWNDDGHCVWPYADFGKHWEIWTAIDELGSPAWTEPPRPWWRLCCR